MKKLVCLLLAMLMLLAVVSCGNQPGGDDTTATPGDTTAPVAEDTTPVVDLSDNLPEKKFDREFRIYRSDAAAALNSIVCFEPAGDQMNEAVFAMNTTVSERFGVTFSQTTFPNSKVVDNVTIFINAQEDAYDMVCGYDVGMGDCVKSGYWIDLNTLDYFDYSKPWWQKNALEQMTVNDKMYLGSNSISYWPLLNSRVVFMNKDEAKNLGIEVPYEDVLNGTWTLDKMIEMTKNVYRDDGNGVRDDADFYGYVQVQQFYCVLECVGITPMKEDPTNILVWDLNNEKTVNFIETLYSWLTQTDGGYIKAQADAEKMFAEGRALMSQEKLTLATQVLYAGEMDYAILPYPKYDLTQEVYICGGNDTPFAIPKTNGDLEFTAIIIEAMSAEGYKQVRPVVFDSALKYKYALDTESMEVMELIDEYRNLDFSYIFGGNQTTSYSRVLSRLLGATPPSTDFASWYATGETAENERLAAVIAAYSD